MASTTRRDLLKSLGIAGTAALLGVHARRGLAFEKAPAASPPHASAPGAAPAGERTGKAGVAVVKRVDAFGSSGSSALGAYAEVVRRMRALPSSDSRNWLNFADIHKNFCPHGNWYFLPWHRAYLMALEQVGRQLLGNANFALPYWDWTKNGAMPPQFFDRNSALFNPTRELKAGESLCDRLSGPDCKAYYGPDMVREVINARPFQNFGSTMPQGQNSTDTRWQRERGSKDRLEYGPHDNTHGLIGGEMGSVPTSARDPVFYLHHANIDRFWSAWSGCGGRAESDSRWRDFKFVKNFPTADGTSRSDVVVSSLIDTTLLGYEYDDLRSLTDFCLKTSEVQRAVQYRSLVLAEYKTAQTVRLDRISEAQLKLSRKLSISPKAVGADAAVSEGNEGPRIFAILRGVTFPRATGQTVRVFVDRANPSASAKADDGGYVTSFGFFGAHGDHAGHGDTMDLRIDVTEALSKLAADGRLQPDRIRIQLSSAAYAGEKVDPEASQFHYSSIELEEQTAVHSK